MQAPGRRRRRGRGRAARLPVRLAVGLPARLPVRKWLSAPLAWGLPPTRAQTLLAQKSLQKTAAR
ncbi:MAG: hypothetical protein RR865_12765, partial [Clostridia bacterium]